MTARALQRVVVRMLYDAELVDAVYADAATALADVPLTEAERTWLIRPDRRRWAADPLRRTRGLQAVLEEYPTAGARAAIAWGIPALDRFFSSTAFHRCVQTRGSLADAFGRFLIALGDPGVAALAAVERAIAAVRRAPPRRATAPARPDGIWSTAPWARGVVAPAGTLAAWQKTRAMLAGHSGGPVGFMLDPQRHAMPAFEPDPATREGLIVESLDDVAVGEGSVELATFLVALEDPVPWPEAARALRGLGAEADEVFEVAADLLSDGLLTNR